LAQLFLVSLDNGQVLDAVEMAGMCEPSVCGFAVAGDGTFYINDLNSTRIYRIRAGLPMPTL
jgi:hypothetical protein